MREYDRLTVKTGRATLEALMQHAGRAVADAAEELRRLRGDAPRTVVLVGNGNNGGDALVAAKLLFERAWDIQLVLARVPDDSHPAIAHIWENLPQGLRADAQCVSELQSLDSSDALLIDGLLGTGYSGEMPREPIATLIRFANASHRPILSIDLPSGLNGDTGEGQLVIQATATVCLAAVKTGLLRGNGPACAGRLVIAPFPFAELLERLPHGPEIFGASEARKLLPRFPFDAHKFQRGVVTVLGGSRQYGGAPILAGSAALHAGAGLAQVFLPQNAEVFCQAPQALIVQRVADDGTGFFSCSTLPALEAVVSRTTAFAAGPGMTRNPASLPVLAELLGSGKPLVLDADALNLLATTPSLLENAAPTQTVLTPHAGEFARLQQAFGLPATIDRGEAAIALAQATRCIVVLKGARSVVAAPDGRLSYNLSGCPALATAGSGDVLTGVIAAFLANGLAPYDASRLAVWAHGAAAEHATRPGSAIGLIADDLPRHIQTLLAQMAY